MNQDTKILVMGKNTPKKDDKAKPGRRPNPANQDLEVLYIEIEPWLKEAIEKIAGNEKRTLKAKISMMLEAEAARAGIEPPAKD